MEKKSLGLRGGSGLEVHLEVVMYRWMMFKMMRLEKISRGLDIQEEAMIAWRWVVVAVVRRG